VILADTDILSTLAKVGRLPLLIELFQTTIHITPSVLRELAHSLNLRRQYAEEVFSSISVSQIQVVSLTQGEAALRDILPDSLGAGEREKHRRRQRAARHGALQRDTRGTLLTLESNPVCTATGYSSSTLGGRRCIAARGARHHQRFAGEGSDAVQAVHCKGHFCGLDIDFYPAKEALGGAVPSYQAC
jgi:hypothetical protein